jgi:hypothetical protein
VSIDQDPEECIHGMWPASSCALCKERPVSDQTWVEKGRFAASYSGRLNACGHTIAEGDTIVRQERGGEARFVCEACA